MHPMGYENSFQRSDERFDSVDMRQVTDTAAGVKTIHLVYVEFIQLEVALFLCAEQFAHDDAEIQYKASCLQVRNSIDDGVIVLVHIGLFIVI